MTGRCFAGCVALCLLPWSCLSIACGDAAGMATALGMAPRGDAANGTSGPINVSATCMALVPPHYGYCAVHSGSGSSLGSVVAYWCEEGYQLVGSERLVCLHRNGVSAWSHRPPYCEAVPRPLDKGFRVAVVASLISGAIILALSISFAVCCWQDRTLRSCALRHEAGQGQQLGRKCRGGRKAGAPERGRIAFGRLTHYHRRDYHLSALSSSVFPGAFAGCNNPAFQRSPERFPKPPAQGPYAEVPALLQAALPPPALPSPPAYTPLLHRPGNILLSAVPGPANLPRDLLPLYYRAYEDHTLLSKLERPI